MNDHEEKHDCHPAHQPHPPGDKCDHLPETKPPTWDDPDPCKDVETGCECPPKPGKGSDCLEKLITEKAGVLAAAEKTKAFKTDLEALLAKAKVATQDYTRDKYDQLTKQWDEQDQRIAKLIGMLICHLSCWRCVIECYVCPLLNDMYQAEQRLHWDSTKYPKAYNLYDLYDWHVRDKEAKEWRFNRIKSVLAAWEKPAQTIEKILADNAKLIKDSEDALGSGAPKVVYDLFLRLIPLHLAIAPPWGSNWKTRIDKKYTKFCECDKRKPDDYCCGPDTGIWGWSLRQRLVGPQPYLIDPNDYFKIICCLIEHRYGPAQLDLINAEVDVLTAEADIKRNKALIEDGLKNFEKTAKGAIPSVIECYGTQIVFEAPSETSQSS